MITIDTICSILAKSSSREAFKKLSTLEGLQSWLIEFGEFMNRSGSSRANSESFQPGDEFIWAFKPLFAVSSKDQTETVRGDILVVVPEEHIRFSFRPSDPKNSSIRSTIGVDIKLFPIKDKVLVQGDVFTGSIPLPPELREMNRPSSFDLAPYLQGLKRELAKSNDDDSASAEPRLFPI